MNGDQVTVTITNWNGKHYLEECIASVLRQTVRPKEIILVDNASDDGSIAWTKAAYPEVRIVRLPKNEGPCPARNAGLTAATTPLVFALDNDAVLQPDCLEKLLTRMQPDVAIVQPRAVFYSEPDRVHYDGADMHFVGMMTLHHFYLPVKDADPLVRDIDACIAVALLMDKEKILEIDAYDPTHFILFEDHDISYRVRSAGYRIVRDPNAVVLHKEGTAGISFRKARTYAPRRVFLHSRNRWLVILKCHGWRTILFSLPMLFLYDAAYFFFAIKNRSVGDWMKGKWDIVKRLPAILTERKKIQRRRKVRDRDLLKALPLTISPLIERRGLVARLEAFMGKLFTIWWRLIRRLA